MGGHYNKTLYKILLLAVKYLPLLIAIIYFISIIVGCFGVQLIVIPNLFFMSPITAGFMILVSFVFRCCIWHRLPIYYGLTEQGIAFVDYYSPLVITSSYYIFIHLTIAIVFIILGMYFKNKYNVKRKRTKTSSS